MICPKIELLERRNLLSGITFITHGQGGSAGGDVARAANLMAQRAGGASQYTMKLGSESNHIVVKSFTLDSGSPDPNTTANGEIIVKLDWSDEATASTSDIASAVTDYLLTQKPTGHSLLEQEIAFAGPSRGASVFSNVAAQLGRRGVWVDQLTFLDPVPIPFYDPKLLVTSNVIFADDYWRSDGNPLNADFDGQAVSGAHNVNLKVVQKFHDIDAHPSVAAYYLATINPDMPLVSPARAEWFQSPNLPRNRTGFYFSRIAGGPRPSDGLSSSHGGTAKRDSVKRSGSQWSNVDDLALKGGKYKFASGKAVRVTLNYEDVDSTSTLFVYLDRDKNPYNGNRLMRLSRYASKKTGVSPITLTGSTLGAPAGKYYLYAQITDKAGHSRYSYINRALTLTKPVTTQAVSAPLAPRPLTLGGSELHSEDSTWF
jgi:hypothetical protein